MLRRRPVSGAPVASGASGNLKRSFGTFQLTMFGVGATIGTGIFFVLAQAVPEAGPGVIVSFIIAGIAAGLAAICYAELASAVPISGSAYSYAYTTLGEAVAMVVAACLLLEYGVATAAVAVGWSGYVNKLLSNLFGFQMPHVLSAAPWDTHPGWVNLPAVILIGLCALLLIRGASESARVNAIMVLIKLGVLGMFMIIAFSAYSADHLKDFVPFGVAGIGSAAGTIFFSYIGLDAVSTAGDEVKDPQKTMPRALIAALVVVTGVYVLVALAALGTQPWQDFAEQETAGLAIILDNVTHGEWASTILAAGAVVSIFTVTLVTMYGQTRILFAMGRDGLLPARFAKVNPRTMTPVHNTVIVAIFASTLAAFIPLDSLADMVSIGTLTAFSVVAVGVIVLRVREPDLPRGFKVPGYPVTPVLSVLACGYILDLAGVQRMGGGGSDLLPDVGSAPQCAQRGSAVTIVVGYLAGKVGPSALHLAVRVARMHKTSLTVATIVRRHWPTPSLARVDAEYELWSEQLAAASAREAQRYLRRLADGIEVSYHHRAHRSVSAGLLDVVEELEAEVLVLGSFPSGRRARVLIGSTADRLLHSSPVPVAITPRRYRCYTDRLTRLSCGYSATSGSVDVVRRCGHLASRYGVPMRVITFAVRGRTMYPPEVGLHAEASVLEAWAAQARELLEKLRINGVVSEDVVLQVVTGNGWAQALDAADWQDGEILALGTSPFGDVARVFLGSWSGKIIRYSPVPVLVLPG
ncbi:amino acid ABC transporter [Mycobacterium tuberculosis]|nr:amino acid ABC transporter [Mycobacterium tuberculosis]